MDPIAANSLTIILAILVACWVGLSLEAMVVSATNWREAWKDWHAHVVAPELGLRASSDDRIKFLKARVEANRDRTGMAVVTLVIGLIMLFLFLHRYFLGPVPLWMSLTSTIASFVLFTFMAVWQVMIARKVRTARRLVDKLIEERRWDGKTERRGKRND